MKCPKCGSSRVVDNAKGKKCVACDFEWIPKKTGCGTWLVLIFIGLVIVPYFLGKNSYDEYKQNAEQSKASNIKRIVTEAENTSPTESSNKPKNLSSSIQDNSSKQNTDDSILNAFGVWDISATEDEFNGNKNVYFENRTIDYFIGHFNQKKYPKMWVRCKDNKTDILIDFDVTMTCFDGMKIGLKFDDDKPYHETWTSSTSCDALFARNPINLLKKMANKKKLIVKFTPFQSGDINVTFDLTGIDKVKDKIAGVCHWKK